MRKCLLPLEQRQDEGRALRKKLPRSEQVKWEPAADRPDPVKLLLDANRERLKYLLPIKWGRMAASPFGFYRGATHLMARDLGALPTTGIEVQVCGDAHVRNLGAYAAADCHLVFDINDFDETVRGPWEWDLKRLVVSVVLAGREAGDKDTDCENAVLALVRCYRESLQRFAKMKVVELERYEIRREMVRGVVRNVLAKAARVTIENTLQKLTEPGKDGVPKIANRPPLLTPVSAAVKAKVLGAAKEYRESLGPDHQQVLDGYTPAHVSFKVVGTGSVGTRDYIILLFGNGSADPLFLQVKQELRSCYAPYLPNYDSPHEGRRVAEGQHRMQTVCDPLLGWTSIEGNHYIVRQLRDHKASIDPEALSGKALTEYALVAGEVLAKAHARTGDGAVLSGYCGTKDVLDEAMAGFAKAYADQTEKDHRLFVKAVRSGKVKAMRGL